MEIYQLDYVIHEPNESEGWMYLAEAPALQGCMAWGDTPEETLEELRAVAKALIQSRKERGIPLPSPSCQDRRADRPTGAGKEPSTQASPDTMQGALQCSNYEVACLNGVVRWVIIGSWAERIAICVGHQ